MINYGLSWPLPSERKPPEMKVENQELVRMRTSSFVYQFITHLPKPSRKTPHPTPIINTLSALVILLILSYEFVVVATGSFRR